MAEVTLPEPIVGAKFRDRFSDDFEWQVTESQDPSLVRLVGILDGQSTGAVLDWPVNRWFVLFEGKQMLLRGDE